MKKNYLFVFLAIILVCKGNVIRAQDTLSSVLFSINGWMTDTVGGGTNPLDTNQCPGLMFDIPCIAHGDFYNNLPAIDASKAVYCRFGGIKHDQNKPTIYQYRRFVDSVRTIYGMTPILQIPVNLGDSSQPYDTLKAQEIISWINDTFDLEVKMWSIGNEPDLDPPQGYGYDSPDTAFLITTYIQNFSKAMRRAVPGFEIKILGPDLASWSCDPVRKMKKVADSLLTPGQRCDITGLDPETGKPWIDYFTYHSYGGKEDTTVLRRQTMIRKLRSEYNFAETLDYLNLKLDSANVYHERDNMPLLAAITEANVSYTESGDAWWDVKANGFYAGQHWLEIASIAAENNVAFVSYWSAVEPGKGFIKADGTKRSSYFHFKKAAENLSGNYYTAEDTSALLQGDIPYIKAFGTKNDDQIAIFILNQDSLTSSATYRRFALNLNGSYPVSDTNEIKISMGVNKTYQDTIEAASTMFLVFDLYGNLSQKYWYKQSDDNSPEGFQPSYCSNDTTYANQSQLQNNYSPAIYRNITIGDGNNSIQLNDTTNTVFRFTNKMTINGPFSTKNKTFKMLPTQCE